MFSDEHSTIQKRRESIFIIISGLFLGSLTMLNILGISRLLDFSFIIGSTHIPFKVFVGVLPYPITFLCTDLISELYGKRRANMVVWVGFMLNIWVLLILWFGGLFPEDSGIDSHAFFTIRSMAFGATTASMLAYLSAQFIDVHVFHYLKNLTDGKHLWLRNNGSTMVSQLLDTVIVVMVTHYFIGFKFAYGANIAKELTTIILAGYAFKFAVALLDTIPFYIAVKSLKKYLEIQ